jgi:hypothetical protein
VLLVGALMGAFGGRARGCRGRGCVGAVDVDAVDVDAVDVGPWWGCLAGRSFLDGRRKIIRRHNNAQRSSDGLYEGAGYAKHAAEPRPTTRDPANLAMGHLEIKTGFRHPPSPYSVVRSSSSTQ